MSLRFHPHPGTIVVCDYSGFVPPEMTKRRPAIVISPRFRLRAGLCTVVPLSTSKPQSAADYHCELAFDPPLPPPYDSPRAWVKADMMAAVALSRLSLPFVGNDRAGQRCYDQRVLASDDFRRVQACVLNGIGLGRLTAQL